MERRQFLQSTALGAAATILVVAPPAAAATHVSFLQENVMSDPIRPYEPLTSENAALVLVDHQVGLMTGVRDYSTGELKHNVVALAKAAKALKLPIIVTTTARDSMWGPTFPELVEALPGVPIARRSTHSTILMLPGHRHDRPQEADLRGHLPRSLRGVPCHHRRWQGPPRLCGRRRLRNVQRDQTTGRSSAHAAGRRDRLGLREPDGGNPERQRTTRGRRRVRCNGHALGEARGADCARLWQVNDAGSAGGRFWVANEPDRSSGGSEIAARADATLLKTRFLAKSVELGMTMSCARRVR